jgi:hypothetical protein
VLPAARQATREQRTTREALLHGFKRASDHPPRNKEISFNEEADSGLFLIFEPTRKQPNQVFPYFRYIKKGIFSFFFSLFFFPIRPLCSDPRTAALK